MAFLEQFMDEDEDEDEDDRSWVEDLIDEDEEESLAAFLAEIREARRKRQRREWDKLHLATVSTRVTVDEGRRFRRLCRALRTTRYKVLAAHVRALLDKYGY